MTLICTKPQENSRALDKLGDDPKRDRAWEGAKGKRSAETREEKAGTPQRTRPTKPRTKGSWVACSDHKLALIVQNSSTTTYRPEIQFGLQRSYTACRKHRGG